MATIAVLDPEQFAPHVVRAAQIYGAAMQRAPEYVVQRREIMQAHLSRRGFVAVCATADVTAEAAEELVGFGYGYLGRAGEWWHDVVNKALGRNASKSWLVDAFELAELHVDPAYQHQGIGRQILQRLLDVSGGSTVVLSTHDRESPARELYRSVGFVDLLGDFRFPGSSEVYAVMGLRR